MRLLPGVDVQLYEAASIDGANRVHLMWHVSLPAIKNTIVVMFILRVGSMMSVGSEKVLLMYNELTYDTADVISTFVYPARSSEKRVQLFNGGRYVQLHYQYPAFGVSQLAVV